MRNRQNFALTFAALSLILTLPLAPFARAASAASSKAKKKASAKAKPVAQATPIAEPEAPPTDLASLLMNPAEPVRGPASEQWPEDLAADFVLSEPDRAPASAHSIPPAKVPARRSRLPAAVSDGFELRVRYNKLTSMFWVLKRDNKMELMFANSGGSRASRDLDPQTFSALHAAAARLPASEANIANCREASMQIHVVNAGQPERTATMCVTDKTKHANELRILSQSLAALVR